MIRRTTLLPMLLVVGTAMLPSCTTPEEDSCNIRTPGIYVEYEAYDLDNSARVRATFWVGNDAGGTVLSLGACGDTIAVNGANLGEKTDGGIPVYEATVPSADAYEFIFSREGEDPYSSTVSTPPTVTLTAPTASTTISRAEAFDVTWENNGSGSINLLIEGDCIQDYPNVMGDSVPDNGTHTVNAGGIETFDSKAEETCTATVELERESVGSLSGSLKGTVRGYAVGRTTFTSTL